MQDQTVAQGRPLFHHHKKQQKMLTTNSTIRQNGSSININLAENLVEIQEELMDLKPGMNQAEIFYKIGRIEARIEALIKTMHTPDKDK